MTPSPVRLAAILFAAALLGPSATGLWAEVRVLHPDADTALMEESAANNLGASDLLIVGRTARGFHNRALLRFDLNGRLPADAQLEAATLQFTVASSGGIDDTVGWHRVLVAWTEGKGAGKTGAPAVAGEPTWSHRAWGHAPWGTAGGRPDQDYAAAPSAVTRLGPAGRYTVAATPELTRDLRGWLTGEFPNHGWMLISRGGLTNNTAKRLAAREDAVEGPVLTVAFTPGPSGAGPRIDRLERVAGAGAVVLHFQAEAGNLYAVQYRDALAGGPWTLLTNIVAKFESFPAQATDGADAPRRFYRFIAWPID